jgi:diguanylate cyclase
MVRKNASLGDWARMKIFGAIWGNRLLFNWLGEFIDDKQEKAFQQYILHATLRRVKLSLALSSGAYFCGIAGDYLDSNGLNTTFWIMATCRVAVLLAGIAMIIITAKRNNTYASTWAIAGFMVLIGVSEAVSITVDKMTGLPQNGVPFIILMVIFYYLFSPPRLLSAIVGGQTSSLIYVVTLIAAGVSTATNVITVIIFLLLANLFGYYFFVYSACGLRNRFLVLEGERALNRRLQVEIAERKKVEEQLMELATIDALTNVSNRRHFINLATSELSRFRRTGSVFCLLMMDIDHFKLINDNYGHDIGDLALKKLVEICRANLRVNDIIGRLGGEEFIALLPDTDLEQAVIIAQRIRHAVENISIETASGRSRITISIGVTTCTDNDSSLDHLMKTADVALYRAKRKGRNTVCFSANKTKEEDAELQN